MKSNFLKLGSMLLCGAMFATVACTDFSEDMNDFSEKLEAQDVTLGQLQEKLADLEDAQEALEALVALKADTEALNDAVEELSADVAAVEGALKNYATKEEVNAAVATATASITDLYGKIEALQAEAAKHASKEEVKKVADELAAAKTALEASMAEVEKAAKAYTDALANGAVAENTAAIAELQTAVATLKTDVATLKSDVASLQTKVAAAEAAIKKLNEETIPALQKSIADVAAQVADNTTAIAGKVDQETFDAAVAALAAADATLNNLFNTLVGDLYGLIQSLVFVPEYADMSATAHAYTLDGEYLNDQVVVRGTYQVTPFAHVNKIGTTLAVKAVLQEVGATRSAETPYIWADDVNVTATNDATGKFDVDAIFDVTKLNSKKNYVLTLYVQHPDAVNQDPVDEDDNMGVTGVTESFIQNYMSSNFVLVEDETFELLGNYYLVKNNKAYARVNDAVEWSATADEMKKSPLAGYEVMIKIDNKFTSLEDAAELFCVEPELITPKYWQNEVKGGAKNIKKFDAKEDADFEDHKSNVVCNVHGVAEGTAAWEKTYSIAGQPTPATAKDFVGHRLTVNGYLYFGKDVTKVADLNKVDLAMADPVVYTYTIDYRTASLRLESTLEGAHSVAWNYETAKKLTTAPTVKAYDKSLSTLGEQYSEYAINKDSKIKDIDYKEVMEKAEAAKTAGDADAVSVDVTPTPAKVNNVNVQKPNLVITPETHLIAEIASVNVTDYAFYAKDVRYAFKQTYRDYDTFTKVEYLYDLTLGAKPDSVPVAIEIGEIGYRNTAYTNDLQNTKLDIDKLNATAFAAWLPANTTEYQLKPDFTGATDPKLYAGKVAATNELSLTKTQIFLNGPFELSAADIDKVYRAVDANGKSYNGVGFVQRTVSTWYGVDFVYTANFTITEPAYLVKVVDAYVDVENGNKAYLDYQYDSNNPVNGYSQYTIKNADLTNYFKVTGKNDDNKVVVRFTIKPIAGATGTPGFVNYSNVAALDLQNDILPDGTIKPGVCEIAWNNYNALTANVEAQLYVNDVKFLDPVVVTLVAPDPIEYITAENVSVVRATNDATTANPLAGVSVATVEGKYTAADFLSADTETTPNDAGNYGASFDVTLVEKTAGQPEVYYYDAANVKTYLPKEHYNWDAASCNITLLKEAAHLLRPIYADFEVKVVYTLNGDVDYTAEDCAKKVAVQVEFKTPANN